LNFRRSASNASGERPPAQSVAVRRRHIYGSAVAQAIRADMTVPLYVGCCGSRNQARLSRDPQSRLLQRSRPGRRSHNPPNDGGGGARCLREHGPKCRGLRRQFHCHLVDCRTDNLSSDLFRNDRNCAPVWVLDQRCPTVSDA
jgi:hypothetical protein